MSHLQMYPHDDIHDHLTGLPGRESILTHLDEDIPKALALININGFGDINQLYGQKFGDKVLQEVAFFLRHNLDLDNYCLYKMPGDEFAITTDLDKTVLYNMLMKLIYRFDSYKFKIDTHTLYLSVTAGLSCSSGPSMLEHAKQALKWAKESKRPLAYMRETLVNGCGLGKCHEMLENIKFALEYDKVYPLFQPIYCNRTSKVLKYEALMRIDIGKEKTLSPQDFLEFSKKARLYPQLTKRIIRKSLNAFENREESISINLSIEDIMSPDVSSYLFDEINAFKEPERIVIEITETEGIDNHDIVKDFVQQLKKHGVKIALDDFGSGYSNFSHLLDLNADIIKIDGSIIQRICSDAKSKILTKTIAGMAKEMGMRVVAEFVSDQGILEEVISLGIDESQGFHLGKPQRLI